jgi:S-adenosyl-L-methionine hydrolase (adenosine-forming)
MTPRSGRGRLVTLASDVGAAYAAQMKGVLLGSVDPGHLIDLVHDLPAHGVPEAAFVVRAIGVRFPPGTIHLVVVDPGVGGVRAPLAIACRDGSVLVGPDNGVLAPLAKALGGGTAYRLDAAKVGSSARVGTTFDGRDLFAPAAARLYAGVAPARLGRPGRYRRLVLPEPRPTAGGADGEVVHVDHFGNLITNIPTAWVPARTLRLRATVGRSERRELGWATSYEAAGAGRLLALGSSFGTVELAVAGGRAADRLRRGVGAAVALRWTPGGRRATRTVNSDRTRKG